MNNIKISFMAIDAILRDIAKLFRTILEPNNLIGQTTKFKATIYRYDDMISQQLLFLGIFVTHK
jgi:hypothetical protein